MDVVEFWQRQVDLWNQENYCDRCWTFGAPLTEEGVNRQQQPQEAACCVNVILASLRETILPRYNASTGLMNVREQTHTMTVHFLVRDEMGKNTYNESLGHPIEESKWKTIIQPLKRCLRAENLMRFCEILGYRVEIASWASEVRINWLDDAYTGLSITTTFRSRET